MPETPKGRAYAGRKSLSNDFECTGTRVGVEIDDYYQAMGSDQSEFHHLSFLALPEEI